MKILPLLLLAAVTVAAAGCGGGAPSSFADCRQSGTRGGIEEAVDVYPSTFDCLVRAYRGGCRAAEARIGVFGIDAGDDVLVRIYRRGGRCAGDVVATTYVMENRGKPRHARCGQTYLFRGKLTLFGCGDEGDLSFVRGSDCGKLFERIRQRACQNGGHCRPKPKRRTTYPLAC